MQLHGSVIRLASGITGCVPPLTHCVNYSVYSPISIQWIGLTRETDLNEVEESLFELLSGEPTLGVRVSRGWGVGLGGRGRGFREGELLGGEESVWLGGWLGGHHHRHIRTHLQHTTNNAYTHARSCHKTHYIRYTKLSHNTIVTVSLEVLCSLTKTTLV